MKTTTVTLADIRKHGPCYDSWKKLLSSLCKTGADNTAVELEYILDLLGLDDALWALRALPDDMDNSVRLLACDLVEPALKYTDDPRPAQAVEMARRYARGDATTEDLGAAWEAAREAVREAAWEAAREAAWGAARSAARGAAWEAAWGAARGAAREAAWGAAWGAALDEQEQIFRAWLKDKS